jgi:hypothetical protein
VTLRPKPLTEKQKNLLLELAAEAIDLGMPASVLGRSYNESVRLALIV